MVDAPVVGPAPTHAAAVARLANLIEHERKSKDLPAVSIALVDGTDVVWAAGYGFANPQRQVPATAQTVYRVGSVSKLFTDMAVMQLVERGELDLDASITKYLPDFQPKNPFGRPITLRQLTSHRSGLVRESPIGHYFDPIEPSLADTVASLNQTTLVYEPETKTKYSNAGVSVIGYVLERTRKQPFADYIAKALLEPLGFTSSGFVLTPPLKAKLANANMWTYDGRTFPAPTFSLGTAPAGNLYSTVLDLARFLVALNQAGRVGDTTIVQPATLTAMWTPQFVPPDQPDGFGIGFSLSRFRGHRRVGHGGAVYGFATELAALPEKRLGVAVVASRDVANGTVRRVADYALDLLLAVREGKPLPELELSTPVEPAFARKLKGRYAAGDRAVVMTERGGRLFLRHGSFRLELKSLGGKLIVDDPISFGLVVELPEPDAVAIDGVNYRRAEQRPGPAPDRLLPFIGEYGWDHNVLYILEDRGTLYALIEWFFYYPLRELGPGEFAFPAEGLYHGERLVFERGASGAVKGVTAASVYFPRRAVGPSGGQTFRIAPIRPIDELRTLARTAQPPKEAGNFRPARLVELARLDPTIRLDVRYATTNNFMGAAFYDKPNALLQEPAAAALVRVNESLKTKGYGLLIYDGYRPWYVTKMFWEATPTELRHFVADPGRGSRHNRGCAVDLSLYYLESGKPVEMVSGYDEFSPRAYPDYPGETSLARWHRELLRHAMQQQGFSVYEFEWWHFDYQDWRNYAIGNDPIP